MFGYQIFSLPALVNRKPLRLLAEALGLFLLPSIGSLRCKLGALIPTCRSFGAATPGHAVKGSVRLFSGHGNQSSPCSAPGRRPEWKYAPNPHLIQPSRRCNRTVTRARYYSPCRAMLVNVYYSVVFWLFFMKSVK